MKVAGRDAWSGLAGMLGARLFGRHGCGAVLRDHVGRGSAIAIAGAAALLFEIYVLFLLPLPGTGGTVPPTLGAWTVYLMCLAAAGVTTIRNADRPRASSNAHP